MSKTYLSEYFIPYLKIDALEMKVYENLLKVYEDLLKIYKNMRKKSKS